MRVIELITETGVVKVIDNSVKAIRAQAEELAYMEFRAQRQPRKAK